MNKDERIELKLLREHDDLVVLKADKGNVTVVMSSSDYDNEIKSLLQNEANRLIQKDSTSSIIRKGTALLNTSIMRREIIRSLKPSAAAPPKIYGQPKIYKDEAAL